MLSSFKGLGQGQRLFSLDGSRSPALGCLGRACRGRFDRQRAWSPCFRQRRPPRSCAVVWNKPVWVWIIPSAEGEAGKRADSFPRALLSQR